MKKVLRFIKQLAFYMKDYFLNIPLIFKQARWWMIRNHHLVHIGTLCLAGGVAMFTFGYMTKSLNLYFNKSMMIDALVQQQLSITYFQPENEVEKAIWKCLYTEAKHALGISPDGKLMLCMDIFQDPELREELKAYISEMSKIELRTPAQGGRNARMTRELAGTTLDSIIAKFQRRFNKHVIYFENKGILMDYYKTHFQSYKYSAQEMLNQLPDKKYWLLALGVAITVGVITYKVGSPMGEQAVEALMLKYMPPNS